jgi:hypothetical protein
MTKVSECRRLFPAALKCKSADKRLLCRLRAETQVIVTGAELAALTTLTKRPSLVFVQVTLHVCGACGTRLNPLIVKNKEQFVVTPCI